MCNNFGQMDYKNYIPHFTSSLGSWSAHLVILDVLMDMFLVGSNNCQIKY